MFVEHGGAWVYGMLVLGVHALGLPVSGRNGPVSVLCEFEMRSILSFLYFALFVSFI